MLNDHFNKPPFPMSLVYGQERTAQLMNKRCFSFVNIILPATRLTHAVD